MGNNPFLLSTRPMKGKTMSMMVHRHMAGVPAGAINPSYTPLNAAESARNQSAAAGMRQIAHVTNTTIMRIIFPGDAKKGATGEDFNEQVKKAQAGRQAEWYRQSAMPWGSTFMHTPTDKERLNNPAQHSAMQQRQLTIPSSYGQFYAFMHAMSAAFGSLQQ